MPTEVVSTIGASKDYATPEAWEAATRGDLVTADEVRVGEIYGQINVTGNCWFNQPTHGTVTDATRFRWLRPGPGQAYDPVSDTGAKITRSDNATPFRITENFVRIGACGTDRGGLGILVDGSGTVFQRCIRVDRQAWIDSVFGSLQAGSNVSNTIFQASVGVQAGSLWFTNCHAIGSNRQALPFSGARYGIRTDQASATASVFVLNCAVWQVKQGIAVPVPQDYFGIGITVGSRAYVYNSASLESGDTSGSGDFVTVGTPLGFSHCISGDATASGTGSITGAVTARLWNDAAGGDFSLHPSAGSEGINAGKDVSSEWPENPELDFLGNEHNGDGFGYEVGPFNFDTSASPDPTRADAVPPELAAALDANPEIAAAVASGVPVEFAIRANPTAAQIVSVAPNLALLLTASPETAQALATAPDLETALATVVSPDPAVAVAIGPELALLFEVSAPRVAFELQITRTAALELLVSRLVHSSATVGRTATKALAIKRSSRTSGSIQRTLRKTETR